MIIEIFNSVMFSAVSALLITIATEGEHDSEEREEMKMERTEYLICEGINNKRKTYIAVPKENMGEMPAKRLANNKYFKVKTENLISTIGFIKDGQLYEGLIPEGIKEKDVQKVWVVRKNDKKAEVK